MICIKDYTQDYFSECNIAIGNFDGVHKGHSFLIRNLIDISEKDNVPSVIFTFRNHPLMYINQLKSYYLTLPDEKIDILCKTDADYVIYPDFDEFFKNMDKDDFIDLLIERYNPGKIVVGENFNFGFGRKGTPDDLRRRFGDNAVIIDPIEIGNERISSSCIRKAVLSGNMKKASEFLGYDFFVCGEVVRGNMLGNTLGVPTMNIETGNTGKIIPKSGVYLTYTVIDGKRYESITNIGGAPTINFEKKDKIETFVFDKKLENMYNKKIRVEFLDFLRDEKKFSDLDELKENMITDIEKAKNIIKDPEWGKR